VTTLALLASLTLLGYAALYAIGCVIFPFGRCRRRRCENGRIHSRFSHKVFRDCPRCEEPLSVSEGRGFPFHQCTGCGGIWLSRRSLQRFVDLSLESEVGTEERRAVAEGVRGRRKRRRRDPLVPCPVCRIRMRVAEFAGYSGVLVDQCIRHGWWFDDGELERLGTFLRGGGLEEAEKRRRARRRSRKVAQAWRRRCKQEGRGHASAGLLGGLIELLD